MTRKGQEDLSTWIPKADVVRETGMSERSLERRVQARKIRQGYRTLPGRRPLPVLHPQDVESLRAEIMHQTTEEQGKALAPLSVRPGSPDTFNTLLSALFQNGPKERTAFLGLKEASVYIGLSVAYLKRAIEAGELNAVRDRGFRIRRRDLDAL